MQNPTAFNSSEERQAFIKFRVFVHELAEAIRARKSAGQVGEVSQAAPTSPADTKSMELIRLSEDTPQTGQLQGEELKDA